jgi:hypothetical protein
MQPILTLSRQQIEEALAAHRGSFERARALHRRAQTDEEFTEAAGWMVNASHEIARWLAALEACDG